MVMGGDQGESLEVTELRGGILCKGWGCGGSSVLWMSFATPGLTMEYLSDVLNCIWLVLT